MNFPFTLKTQAKPLADIGKLKRRTEKDSEREKEREREKLEEERERETGKEVERDRCNQQQNRRAQM